MGFGKRRVPVEAAPDHPLADVMPRGQLPLGTSSAAERSGGGDAASQDLDGAAWHAAMPASVWAGEYGDFLRDIGMHPRGDPEVADAAASMEERVARGKAEHEAKLAATNAELAERVPEGSMRGFLLLPEPCWGGRSGRFLTLRLNLHPYDDWNVVLLPADAATAEALDLPPHPGTDTPSVVTAAQDFLAKAEADLTDALERAEETLDFEEFRDRLEATRDRTKALARRFLHDLDHAWENRARSGEAPPDNVPDAVL